MFSSKRSKYSKESLKKVDGFETLTQIYKQSFFLNEIMYRLLKLNKILIEVDDK